jgi:hypothetical protein
MLRQQQVQPFNMLILQLIHREAGIGDAWLQNVSQNGHGDTLTPSLSPVTVTFEFQQKGAMHAFQGKKVLSALHPLAGKT